MPTMTLTLTKREALALCLHVQPHALNAMDDVRKRRESWKSLGLTDLAHDVGELLRNPRMIVSIDWLDESTSVGGELADDCRAFLEQHTGQGPFDGRDGEFILSIHERLKAK